MTSNTKLVHLTHIINWNGQVLPIKDIIAEAKKRNFEVLLDGAHSFALLDVDVQKLGINYFTTALHKWLSGPIPSGMLYVSKEKNKKPLALSLCNGSFLRQYPEDGRVEYSTNAYFARDRICHGILPLDW